MEKLTSSEEQIMLQIWDHGPFFVKDLIAQMDEPKPPYNTVSSVVRLLESKGYLGHKAYGRTYQYFPLIEKSAYRKSKFNQMLQHFFEDSTHEFASFFVKEQALDKDTLNALQEAISKLKPKS